MMRLLFCSILMIYTASSALADYEFKDFLSSQRDKMWSASPVTFARTIGKDVRFRYNDKSRKELRYALSTASATGLLRLDGMAIYEALAEFDDDKLNRLVISIFNRGDGGQWDQGNVDYSVDKVEKIMKEFYPQCEPEKDQFTMGKSRAHALLWKTPDGNYQLKWSVSGSRSSAQCEYLTLVISKDEIEPLRQASKVTSGIRNELQENVKTKDGFKYLEIPMVNQGQKGYCVVAVLERILKYYGSEFDQHQLAQLANTTFMGTKRDDMIDAIKKADNRVGIKMRQLYSNRDFNDLNEFLKLVGDYNKSAKKAKKPVIDPEEFTTIIGNRKIYNFSETIARMDSSIFVECRTREKRDQMKFLENIKKNIDAGVPVGWCVLLGLVTEKTANPQLVGGHMRLIIGYNDATQEIAYSDSWGYGHEFKTMSYNNAWAMSTWLGVLTPRGK